MPPKVAKKAAAKSKAPVKHARPVLATFESSSSSSAGDNTVRNPKGLTLKPMKNPKPLCTCIRGTPQNQGAKFPSIPPTNIYPSRPSPRRVLDGMHAFMNYYELLRVDRNASHMTVFRAWDRYAVKKYDPLIKHKNADMELNGFILWHDVHECLLVDEYTRAFYNSRLEQFERLSAAGLAGRGWYHEAFFPYDSGEEEEYNSSQDQSCGLDSDSEPHSPPNGSRSICQGLPGVKRVHQDPARGANFR